MATPGRLSRKVCFGEFELNLETAELRNGKKLVVLPGKPFQVLKALLERPGELVGRQELIDRLWPDGTFVDFDQSLNKAVNRLREALNDSADAPALIQTLPRKGYRFIGILSNPAPGSVRHDLSQVLKQPENKLEDDLPVIPFAPLPAVASTSRRSPGNAWGKIVALLTAASVLAAGIWFVIRQFRQDGDWVQSSRLTDSGQVVDLALSPDGRFLAYASRSGESDTLRLRDIRAQTDVQLLPVGPQFHGLTWSNDGRALYLLRSDPNDPFFKHLYSMPSTGGPVRKLISDVDSPISFSPDGRLFVFEHCLQPTNNIELIIASPDGEVKRHLATLHNASGFLYQPGPAWSPDGKSIAVPVMSTYQKAAWTMFAVSVEDGSVRTVTSSPDGFGRPVWMDGHNIVLPHLDHNSQSTQLWSMSMSSGKTRLLTHGPAGYLDSLSSTSDHRTLAGVSIQRTANVWSVPLTKQEDAQQLTHSGTPIFDVAELFDGKLLILDGEGIPWVIVADGTQGTRFADIQGVTRLVPCGRFVVLLVQVSGTPSLVRFDRDGTHPTTLASGHLGMPACAADGNSIFYVTTQQPQLVWKLPVDGGVPQQIVEVLGDQIAGQMAVSPNGRYLAYPFTQYGHIPSDGWHIAVIPEAGGPPVTTQPVPSDEVDLHWSPTGASLQYLRTIGGTTNLWEQPVRGGSPRQLTKFNSGLAFRFNWSTTKKNLLITRGEIATEAVLFHKSR